jgi:hypothetical protein
MVGDGGIECVINERARPRFASLGAGRSRAGSKRMTALRAGALIATFRCDAPGRCGAFGDARRVVADNVGGRARHRRACASLAASLAGSVAFVGRWRGYDGCWVKVPAVRFGSRHGSANG